MRTFFIPEMQLFAWVYNKVSLPYEVLCHCERSVAISRKGILVAYAAMLPSARCCLRRDVAFATMCAFGTICAKSFAPLKSPDKSQGNAIIRSIIADYFVPKILSPASPRPGTM